jgi:hypothetical protein
MTRPACGFKVLDGPLGMRNGKAHFTKAKWDGCAKRAPKKGELFISGALPHAYKATSDMDQEYFIAIPLDPETYLPKQTVFKK